MAEDRSPTSLPPAPEKLRTEQQRANRYCAFDAEAY
jgi:hypothetical protein